MTDQMDLFRERRARDEGMGLAADHRETDLEYARAIATSIARERGEISINDVRAEIARRGVTLHWGNWTGSIFKDGGWEAMGFTQTKHDGSHARVVRTWRLRYR